MNIKKSTQKRIADIAVAMTGSASRAALLAALCVISASPASASFSNVVCSDFYGNASVSGSVNISVNNYANNSSISVTLNNLSNGNNDINLAAAALADRSAMCQA